MPIHTDLSKPKSMLKYLLGHCHRNTEPNKYLLYKTILKPHLNMLHYMLRPFCASLGSGSSSFMKNISCFMSQQMYFVPCSSTH